MQYRLPSLCYYAVDSFDRYPFAKDKETLHTFRCTVRYEELQDTSHLRELRSLIGRGLCAKRTVTQVHNTFEIAI